MKKLNTWDKIIASLGSVGLIIWVGMSFARTIISYDLYIPGTLNFKPYPEVVQNQTVNLMMNLTLYADIAYILMIVATIVLTVRFIKSMKQTGWMFMCAILLLLTIIPYAIVLYLDYNCAIAVSFFNAGFWSDAVQHYLKAKYSTFSVLEPLSYLAAITSVIFMIFQPLKTIAKTSEKENL